MSYFAPPTDGELREAFDRAVTELLSGVAAACPSDTGLPTDVELALTAVASASDPAAAAHRAQILFDRAMRGGDARFR